MATRPHAIFRRTRRDPAEVPLVVYVPAALRRALKIEALRRNVTLRGLVCALLAHGVRRPVRRAPVGRRSA